MPTKIYYKTCKVCNKRVPIVIYVDLASGKKYEICPRCRTRKVV